MDIFHILPAGLLKDLENYGLDKLKHSGPTEPVHSENETGNESNRGDVLFPEMHQVAEMRRKRKVFTHFEAPYKHPGMSFIVTDYSIYSNRIPNC